MKTTAENPAVVGVGTVIVVEELAVMLLLTTSAPASVYPDALTARLVGKIG
jgi:hypothetical protein